MFIAIINSSNLGVSNDTDNFAELGNLLEVKIDLLFAIFIRPHF